MAEKKYNGDVFTKSIHPMCNCDGEKWIATVSPKKN